MPPPSSENDLKRRARRRLIGAVALTLAAVILLPLLLEDAPPPASQLDVRMPPVATPADAPGEAAVASLDEAAEPAIVAPPAPAPQPEPLPQQQPEPEPQPKPAPKQQPAPAPKPAESTAAPAKPAAAGATYVVQLAALSDQAKADALKARAALSGFPVFTDSFNQLTRVRVGPFDDRKTAEAARAKLEAQGLKGQVVAK